VRSILILQRLHGWAPLFFENIQGYTALTAGSLLIGQGLAMGVGIALSGVLYNRVDPRILAAIGLVLLVIGTYSLTRLEVNTAGLSLQSWLVLRGLGLGFTIPGLQPGFPVLFVCQHTFAIL
jgi:predicted MFS family arabinose efflux permease